MIPFLPVGAHGIATLSQGVPALVLLLNGQPITLNHQFITLRG